MTVLVELLDVPGAQDLGVDVWRPALVHGRHQRERVLVAEGRVLVQRTMETAMLEEVGAEDVDIVHRHVGERLLEQAVPPPEQLVEVHPGVQEAEGALVEAHCSVQEGEERVELGAVLDLDAVPKISRDYSRIVVGLQVEQILL